jgi:hypothetical protein
MTRNTSSSSSSASVAASKSSRFCPCQTIAFIVPGLLDRWISSFHWLRSDVGATIRVADGPLVDLGRCLETGRNALLSLSCRFLPLSLVATGSSGSGSRLVCMSADTVYSVRLDPIIETAIESSRIIVLPIPTAHSIQDKVRGLNENNVLSEGQEHCEQNN